MFNLDRKPLSLDILEILFQDLSNLKEKYVGAAESMLARVSIIHPEQQVTLLSAIGFMNNCISDHSIGTRLMLVLTEYLRETSGNDVHTFSDLAWLTGSDIRAITDIIQAKMQVTDPEMVYMNDLNPELLIIGPVDEYMMESGHVIQLALGYNPEDDGDKAIQILIAPIRKVEVEQ